MFGNVTGKYRDKSMTHTCSGKQLARLNVMHGKCGVGHAVSHGKCGAGQAGRHGKCGVGQAVRHGQCGVGAGN